MINILDKRTIAVLCSIIGWGASAGLFYRAVQINKGVTSQIDICKVLFGTSCDASITSASSWQLGYPLAGIGMAYFGLLALLIIFNKPLLDRLLLIISSLGLGAGIILTYNLFNESMSCPLCPIIHLMNLVVLLSIFLNSKAHDTTSVQNENSNTRPKLKWGIIVLLTLFVGGASELYIVKNSIGTSSQVILNQVFKDFQNEAFVDFPENSLSHKTGPVNAPLQLVVFSSYQCPGCQSFDKSLINIKKKFGDNIRIDFKHYPLSSSCNPSLKVDMQPLSCYAALAAIAADKQGLFQEYHDLLFNSNLNNDSIFLYLAKQTDLDIELWKSDMYSEEAKMSLSDDITIANTIPINATPSVFLNGRKVKRTDETFFTFLLNEELNHLTK